ncbi:tetratricopeptide repeat-containing serine protease family protein [Streptomyces sp. G-G2]|uniref:tetratricopeptide repeat-containing S1 family peptidase n=1 Tax=Streptomyces sp. G-G2 TaxID=3046201 RepID=UPI0024B92407|nr:tetratricopeptide repeat-containing serine protease family protein [Streptomyces sp. G-G2]MDJ0386153.1 tetratricopeptide repeat protein [Streptomyces sp. G-G2]
MDEARLVRVEVPSGRGSGYAVGPRLVLTSAHVVGGAAVVRLFHPGKEQVYSGVVVWRGTPGGRDDAALVLVDDERWAPPSGGGVRWGQLATLRPGQECHAWGVPDVARQPGEAVEAEDVSGKINPGSGFVGNRYVVNLDRHPPARTWAGLSGAPLFCNGLLIGVILAEAAHSGHGVLKAVPAYALHHKTDFRAALDKYGADSTTLRPAEFEDLTARDVPGAAGGRKSPAALLLAERAVVDFHGRDEILNQLTSWCEQDGFGALLLYGPGGQGKTRLGHELSRRLAERAASHGWAVVWPATSADPRSLGVLWEATGPLLVVLDYAENSLVQLSALLEAAEERVTPFKLLLLSRTAGDWWENARAANRAAGELLDGTPVVELPPLEADPVDRRRMYRRAAEAFAARLPGVGGDQGPGWRARALALPVPDLDRAGFDNALTLQMTALADLLDSADQAPAGDRAPSAPPLGFGEVADVEDRILLRERRYWEASADAHHLPPLSRATLQDALAAALLIGATDRERADDVLSRVPSLSDQTRDRRDAVRAWITAIYPPTGSGPWGSLQPDRLVERFVGKRLKDNPDLAHRLVPGADPDQAAKLLTLLTRAAAHPPLRGRLDGLIVDLCTGNPTALTLPAIDVATQVEAPKPLLDALSQVVESPGATLPDLVALADHLPRTSYNLAPWTVPLLERLVASERAQSGNSPDRTVALATRLRELSKRLMDIGEADRALSVVEEAVSLLSQAAEPELHAVRAELAAGWNNTAVCLGLLGRRQEALAAATKAVSIYRKLTESEVSSAGDLSNMVRSLNTLADAQRQLGDARGALKTGSEAVRKRRQLVRDGVEGALPDLASDLNNLAIQCLDTEQPAEALEEIDEALDILRPLAGVRPDAFRPALAMSLSTRSSCLSGMGRWEEALEAVQQSIAIRRRLAEGRPNAFGPGLAMTLNSLAIDLGNLGRYEEAVEAGEESVARYRLLAEAQPEAFRSELAMSLNTQANQLASIGDLQGALTLAEEAAGIYRELDNASPRVFAMGLVTLAGRMGDVGRHQDAVEEIEQAVKIYRSQPAEHSEVVRPDLAACLNNLGGQLLALGRADAALAGIAEAVEICRDLARANPQAFQPALSMYLLHHIVCLRDLDRLQEAVPLVREAVAVELQVTATAPMGRLPESASRLAGFSAALTLAGQRSEAPDVTREAAGIRGRLAQEDPQTHEPQQATTLDLLGRQLSSICRYAEAVAAARKAVAVRRRVRARANTPDHRAALAASLGNLGEYLMQTGRRGKALTAVKEAVRLWRGLSRADRGPHEPAPSMALALLGFLCFSAGQVDEAVEAGREAVDSCDALVRLDPAHSPILAIALGMHGAVLTELDQRAAALPVLERAVKVARPSAETGAGAYRVILASALNVLAQYLAEEPERHEEALAAAEEAVALLTPLAEADSLAHEADLARARASLGLCLARAGRYDEAAEITEGALKVWRRLWDADPAAHELDLSGVLLTYARVRQLAGVRAAEVLVAVDEALAVFRSVGDKEPALVERQQRLALETRTELISRSV